MLINVHQLNYYTPDREPLFKNLHFSLQKGEKAALVGNNGAGKSTLLRILAGIEKNYTGEVLVKGRLYYVPQHYGHFNRQTVAEALGIATLLDALQAVENGATDQHYYDLLEDQWDITARCEEAFSKWGISGINLQQPLAQLSGGMKTRLFLSGIDIFSPDIVLLDEPTNHLDREARDQLIRWMEQTRCTLLLTSHDKQLLHYCTPIWELHANGIQVYGGNYEVYETQKQEAMAAAANQLAHYEKEVKEARLKQQQVLERKQHADAQARHKNANSSDPKILRNARRNNAEGSAARLKEVHSNKVAELRGQLQEAAGAAQMQRVMKAWFEQPAMPAGKVLIQATGINYGYADGALLWPEPLTLTVRSGSRLAIAGANGSGKSSLLGLLQGKYLPLEGSVTIAPQSALLLDQDYTLIDRTKTILEQAMDCNEAHLDAARVHTLLANFLFLPDSWNKSCAVLSGGEMLRLSLCCMVLREKAPDIIFLDEPTNNLDLANITMLGKIFSEYNGTLVVVSHDTAFLEALGITHEWKL